MIPIPYEQFSRLRLSSFFPQVVEPVVMIEGAIGSAIGEAIGRHTHFLWKPTELHVVAEILLDLHGPEPCPAENAEAIMAATGIGLRRDATVEQVTAVFQGGTFKSQTFGDFTFVEGTVGGNERYKLAITVHPRNGVAQFHITRSDKLLLK